MIKTLALLLALLIVLGCAGHSPESENIPPPPSKEAIWVFGHFDSDGKWVPGEWVE